MKADNYVMDKTLLTDEELIFSAMHHDLGKVGDLDFDYYVESIEYYVYANANSGKEQYRPLTALEGGVNIFKYSLDECDGTECFSNSPLLCICDDVWNPVCGCDDVTYSNSCEAMCNNIFTWTPGSCENNSLIHNVSVEKKIMIIIDAIGRELKNIKKQEIIFLIFNDGTVKKVFIN